MKRFKVVFAIWMILFLIMKDSLQVYGKEFPILYAKYAAVIDGRTGRLLYGKGWDKQVPMASTTKILTCILALENAKLTMKKVSVNKKGYGTYNLIINSKVYGVFTIKVVVVPNNCGDICWRMFFSSGKGATRGNLQISLTNPCDGTDGVQYTIGKTKNSNSTKFIKTYKKMTCKKFNKKYVYYIANFTNIKRSATANICVKYRTYAVMNNGKKLYSEWQYE